MTAKAIYVSITKKSLKKIRLHQGEYEWADTGGLIRNDGTTMIYLLYSSSLPVFVSGWCAHSRSVVLQPYTDTKETQDYVPIDLSFYARPFFSTSTLLVPLQTSPPPIPDAPKISSACTPESPRPRPSSSPRPERASPSLLRVPRRRPAHPPRRIYAAHSPPKLPNICLNPITK